MISFTRPRARESKAAGLRTLSHNRLTSFSVSCLQSDKCEIPVADGAEYRHDAG